MKMLRRKRAVAPPSTLPGERIYAVGDIHGRLDLLDAMLDRIETDVAKHPSTICTLVFLGDYVDRGPDSALVLQRLIDSQRAYRTVCLKGNHEALLSAFLTDGGVLQDWGALGGFNTLMSYGLSPLIQSSASQRTALSSQLRKHMPESHLLFLDHLPLHYVSGDYVFVHAGIRPKRRLVDQLESDLLWIRDDFNLYEGRHEKFVVHGHTPVLAPDIRSNRINIDTGAYATGRLTCLVLEDAERRFL